jgi:hypothetical protein
VADFEQANQHAPASSSAPSFVMPPPPPPPTTSTSPSYQPTASPPQNFQQPATFQQPRTYQPFSTAQPASPQFSTAAENTMEKAIGVIVLRKPKSLGRFDSWTAVITNSRLIFAQMTSQMINDAVAQARSQAKADGKGFWGQWSDQLGASFGYARKYLDMAPSAILSETLGNFAVDNYGVSEVKLKLKNVNRGQEMGLQEFEIEFVSVQGKYEFRMDQNDDSVNLLKQVYGQKVKMPFGYVSSHGVRMKLL